MAMSAALIAVGIAVAVGFCSTGVGALIGAIIAAVTILVSWVTKYVNAPDLEFVENDCRTYYPSSTILNMRRNGGLEIGDQFAYHLKVKNTGRSRVWMRARLKMAGDALTGVWTQYVGDWADWAEDAVDAANEGTEVPVPPTPPGTPALPIKPILLPILLRAVVWLLVKWLERKLDPNTEAKEIARVLKKAFIGDVGEDEVSLIELMANTPLEIILSRFGEYEDIVYSDRPLT